jgi:hypothetical protein
MTDDGTRSDDTARTAVVSTRLLAAAAAVVVTHARIDTADGADAHAVAVARLAREMGFDER